MTEKLRLFVLLAFFSAILALMAFAGSVNAESTYAKQKVIYHINESDPALHKSAIGNIQNHINAVGAENIEVKVVMHGDGLALLLEPDAIGRGAKFKHASADENMMAKIDELRLQGVKFMVCKNTLVGRNVDFKKDLYDVEEADIVPSGVAELSHLQAQGFTYLKP